VFTPTARAASAARLAGAATGGADCAIATVQLVAATQAASHLKQLFIPPLSRTPKKAGLRCGE
jgi:hypothetical protein